MKLYLIAVAAAALACGCASNPPAAQTAAEEQRCVPGDAPTGSNMLSRRKVCGETAATDNTEARNKAEALQRLNDLSNNKTLTR